MRAKRAPQAAAGGLARAYGAVVVGLRYPVLAGWVILLVAAVRYAPVLAPSDGGTGNLLPANAPALQTEVTATKIFGAPLDAQVAVVQRNPVGLSQAAQSAAVRDAVSIDRGHPAGGAIAGLAGAVPVLNTGRVFPSARKPGTVAITFLYFRPGTSLGTQEAGGQLYARRYAAGRAASLAGITGAGPATYAQGLIINQRLPWVELATLLAIALIVGFSFLAAGAPLATLLCTATAYLIAVRAVAWVMLRLHTTLPPDVEPVLVVLLLGVTTDYTVFFMSGMRARLRPGSPRPSTRRSSWPPDCWSRPAPHRWPPRRCS